MTRTLVTLGAILIVVGLAWPWLAKLGLSGNRSRRCSTSCIHAVVRLPGDIVIERGNFCRTGMCQCRESPLRGGRHRSQDAGSGRFYFPITSMILIGLVISPILWLFKK